MMRENGSKKVILLIVTSLSILALLAAWIVPQFMGQLDSDQKINEQEMGIELTTSEVILDIGDSFDAKEYIKQAIDNEGNDVSDQLIINEAINTSVESEYEVHYLFMQNDQIVSEEILKVIVKDKSK